MIIANKLIGLGCSPYIIAEMSGNHNQSLERALAIVDAAAKSGADAVKLQTYTSDTMTIDCDKADFQITDPKSLWANHSLYKLYEIAHTPWDWHKPIMDHCKKLGITCFSTPFDLTAVDFLEELNVPAYKIASFENTDIHLIRKVVATGKPLIISTGMAKLSDLELMVQTLRQSGCENFVLLKCTSAYPAEPIDANIRTIPHMRDMFGCEVGLSDHTMGIGVPLASVALGATVIEKHFTLSRAEGGVDADFSLEPQELEALVIESKRAWQSLGKVSYSPGDKEAGSMQFRRSIYFVKALKAGETIGPEHVRCIRPGYGLPPKYLETIIGMKARSNIERGTPVHFADLVH